MTLDLFYPLFLRVPLIKTFFFPFLLFPLFFLPSLFVMCVHVCIFKCNCPCVFVQPEIDMGSLSLLLSTLCSETGCCTEPEPHPFGQACRPVNPWGQPLCLPAPGLQTVLCLYMVPRDLNAGSYVCAVNPFTLSHLLLEDRARLISQCHIDEIILGVFLLLFLLLP